MAAGALSVKWYQTMWLPSAAATYLAICLFDFIVMPVYTAAHNSRVEAVVFQKSESKDIAIFADTLIKSNQAMRQWNPLTLMGGGMFHLAFGALLTGGAVTRGMGKKSEIENYYKYGQNSNFSEPDMQNTQPGRQTTYSSIQRSNTVTEGPSPKTDQLDDIK